MGKITIVGLGPGDWGLVTAAARDILLAAPRLLLRTVQHPSVAALRQHNIAFTSFDALYEDAADFDTLYQRIADAVLAEARQGDVVYAVPGSPLVAERSVALIRQAAATEGVSLTVLPGLSFLEMLLARVGYDPAQGLTLADALTLEQATLANPAALVIMQVYNRHVASEVKLTLMEAMTDQQPVTVLHHLSLPDERVETVALYEIDRLPWVDHLTSLYIPPRSRRRGRYDIAHLADVMARLRAPGGCVWDREQTHASLRRYLVEETYEVLEAIELGDRDKLCEELGDVLLQVVFHARLAEEAGAFTLQDVIDGVTAKMVRRHPHVFGDVTVENAAEVVTNWEAIKKQEKQEHGEERHSVLDGIPAGLPSLLRACKLSQRAARVGFDWPDVQGVWDKVQEELAELRQAGPSGGAAVEEELGDVLFALVNLARFLSVEPETALTAANDKFVRRFRWVEQQVAASGRSWQDFTPTALNTLWDESKKRTK